MQMSELINLTIDGVDIKTAPGTSVLRAALENGIYIPHLCDHEDLTSVGVCRVCLVEIEGRRPTVSCMTPVEEGMIVRTSSEELDQTRRLNLELLVLHHDYDCQNCGKNSNCQLQELTRFIGLDEDRLEAMRKPALDFPIDDSNPYYLRDMNKCVLCGICVRTCEEIQGDECIDFAFRGIETRISVLGDKPIIDSTCVTCGECVSRCPVGALLPRKTLEPTYEVETICPFCGCGCGILVGARGGKVVSSTAVHDSPASSGSLCVKGRFGLSFVSSPERLTTPLIRKDGELVEASWDEALSLVAEKLGHYREGNFATIASAKCTVEDNYVLQKFTRAVMGTNNIDHCARL
jgi:formate dehydrogenase (NADP+) alpha subunit